MKARIRFTSPKGLDGENAIITITDMKKIKVEVTIPMKKPYACFNGCCGY